MDTGYSHLIRQDQLEDEYQSDDDETAVLRSGVSCASTSHVPATTYNSNWVPRKVQNWTGGVFKRSNEAPSISEIYYSVFRAPNAAIFDLPSEGLNDTGPVTSTQFGELLESVNEAIEQGIEPKRIAAGSSGSYFVYNTEGALVGVFKPKDEEPYGPLSPKWTKWVHRNLFPCFFGRSCLIPNNGYIAETAASALDRQLQSFIVPRTEIVYLSSDSFYYTYWDRYQHLRGKPFPKKVGSLQLFLKGYEEADVFLRKHPLPETTRDTAKAYSDNSENDCFQWTLEVLQQFREEIEKLVILDYIMRNTDRGLDNWMIKLEWLQTANGKTPHLKVGAIDSGLSFPWKHPDEWRSYPFGWLFLPLNIIGQPFSQKTRDHYLSILTSTAWWQDTKIAMEKIFREDSEFKKRLWKRQWAIIKGQAFNVAESLKNSDEGPLELARRTRVFVWDNEMEIPLRASAAGSNIIRAIDTPLWYEDIVGTGDQSTADDNSMPLEIPHQKNSFPAQIGSLSSVSSLSPKKSTRTKGSSLALEARYRALPKSSDQERGSLWHELLHENVENDDSFSIPVNQSSHISGDEDSRNFSGSGLGITAAEEAGSRRVIVERLQTAKLRQPLFTWC